MVFTVVDMRVLWTSATSVGGKNLLPTPTPTVAATMMMSVWSVWMVSIAHLEHYARSLQTIPVQ